MAHPNSGSWANTKVSRWLGILNCTPWRHVSQQDIVPVDPSVQQSPEHSLSMYYQFTAEGILLLTFWQAKNGNVCLLGEYFEMWAKALAEKILRKTFPESLNDNDFAHSFHQIRTTLQEFCKSFDGKSLGIHLTVWFVLLSGFLFPNL